jgi:hypothetical protein
MDDYVIEVRDDPQTHATVTITDDGEPFDWDGAQRRLDEWGVFMEDNGWVTFMGHTQGARLPYCRADKVVGSDGQFAVTVARVVQARDHDEPEADHE